MASLFLFDIDGTLVKGAGRVHREAFGHAIRELFGLDVSLDGIEMGGRTDAWILAEVLRRAGVPSAEAQPLRHRAYALMEAYVREHPEDLHHTVLPGVESLLDLLRARGADLALLTGNLRGIALTKLDQAGLVSYFVTGAFGEESEVRADLVPVALRHASGIATRGVIAACTAIIGDTPFDIEAGRSAGTVTVGVATGSFTEDALRQSGADLVLSSFEPAPDVAEALLAL